MSEVKKISPVGNIYGWEESQFGEFVLSQDYDDLAEEAQALREEVAALKHSQQVLIGSRNAHRDERDAALKEVADLRMARDDFKLERDLARKNFCDEQAANYQLQAHLKACLGELSELRARVVVVPDAANDRRKSAHYCRGWNACLNELARLNGKTVSASALDTLRRFATGEVGHLNNGHCPDGLEGHETRDPDCPVCRALIDTEKSK
ncbi:hypothetical protein [Pseudomonas aeruginosa]|uniref:hypothetical protein n=1 Tax=Pseudomonas aeruginosa TaxID=287 RepID=UPI003CC6AD31|nr:hypothetical protein [Pseudomonas aeruginosa]